jgi:protein-disulfide isomerase
MNGAIERGLSLILSVSAATIAGSVLWREFRAPTPAAAILGGRLEPEFVRGWEEALGIGIRVGEASARVTIVEFSDLECPACGRFQEIVREALQQYPGDVSLVFVHMPLQGHRFAMQAARAVDCAESMGRFFPLLDVVFSKQDSLGLKSWGSFAREAGISDSAAISACARDTRPVSRIDAGLALGKKLEISGTPTVFVNGWRFLGPTKDELGRAIKAVLRGDAPNATGTN